jgi:hypothetical protein
LFRFGPNLFGSQMAPIFVFLVAELSFLPTSHTTQAQLCSPHFCQMPPKATTKTKKWGRADKYHLFNLIQARLIEHLPLQHQHSTSGAFPPSRCEEFLPKLQELLRCV